MLGGGAFAEGMAARGAIGGMRARGAMPMAGGLLGGRDVRVRERDKATSGRHPTNRYLDDKGFRMAQRNLSGRITETGVILPKQHRTPFAIQAEFKLNRNLGAASLVAAAQQPGAAISSSARLNFQRPQNTYTKPMFNMTTPLTPETSTSFSGHTSLGNFEQRRGMVTVTSEMTSGVMDANLGPSFQAVPDMPFDVPSPTQSAGKGYVVMEKIYRQPW